MTFEPLESRTLLSAAVTLSLADRRLILDNWTGDDAPRLARFLRTGNTTDFDARLLDDTRGDGRPTLMPGAAALSTLATSRPADRATVVAEADAILAGRFPEQMTSAHFAVDLPADFSWLDPRGTDNPEFPHVLNRQPWWPTLALASRLTGDAAYADALIDQLGSWSNEIGIPVAGSLPWGALNTSVRIEHWLRAYGILRDTAAWTPAANTLFLAEVIRHGQALYAIHPTNFRINKTLSQARSMITMSLLFPELAPARDWLAEGEAILFRCMDAQFAADGGQAEQSPTYQGDTIRILLEAYRVMTDAGVPWRSTATRTLRRAVDAYLQLLSPDGTQAALSDSYREDGASTVHLAGAILDEPAWTGRIDTLDYALRVDPAKATASNTGLPARPGTSALPFVGYFATRTGSNADARQLIFDTGVKGGVHGHLDLLNFELYGYGKPLIADPGLVRYDDSADRAYAMSTPAHNTISIDNLSHAAIEKAGTAITLDQWDFTADEVLMTAHHQGYAGFKGAPVVGRTIWHDRADTFLIVDYGSAWATHTYTSSFNFPTLAVTKFRGGVIRSATGVGDVVLQPLLLDGQSVATTRTFTSSQAPPDEQDPAYRFTISQTGRSALIATLMTTYTGSTPPDVSARWLRYPTATHSGRIEITRDGVASVITITCPNLAPVTATRAAATIAPPPRTPFAVGRPYGGVTEELFAEEDDTFEARGLRA